MRPYHAWGHSGEPPWPSREDALIAAFCQHAALQEALTGDFVLALGRSQGVS